MGFATKEMTGEEKELVSALGLKIARIRSEKKMARTELARKSKLHVQYVYDVETGKRNVTLYVLCKIARTLDMTVSELLEDCILSTK